MTSLPSGHPHASISMNSSMQRSPSCRVNRTCSPTGKEFRQASTSQLPSHALLRLDVMETQDVGDQVNFNMSPMRRHA
jgi:hypothetical protein